MVKGKESLYFESYLTTKSVTLLFRDLCPDNVLLGEKGHLLLTYMCRWADVDSQVNADAIKRLYAAPEVNGIFQLSPAADWWSFGALIFELLTGKVCKYNKQESEIDISIDGAIYAW
jgi:protein kinase A